MGRGLAPRGSLSGRCPPIIKPGMHEGAAAPSSAIRRRRRVRRRGENSRRPACPAGREFSFRSNFPAVRPGAQENLYAVGNGHPFPTEAAACRCAMASRIGLEPISAGEKQSWRIFYHDKLGKQHEPERPLPFYQLNYRDICPASGAG